MNRQNFSNMRVTSLHLQQGLFASLALSVTLIGGQQLGRWETTPQPVATVVHSVAPQQHFKALGPVTDSIGHFELAASDETQTANSQPEPQRWVF